MMMGCDTLLMIGSGFPYSEFLPKEGQARGVQIDLKPDMLSLRYPMEVNLVGDSADTLKLLLPLLEQKTDRAWRTGIEKSVATWWKTLEDRAMAAGQSGQPAARDLGIVAAAARPRHHHQRFRLLRQLVCARPENPARHDVLAVRRPRLDGRGGALRHRRQVRPSRSAGDRAGRRRRHADEQHGRADHRRQVLARMGQSANGSSASSTTRTSTRSPGSSACRRATRSSTPRSNCPTCPTTNSRELIGLKGIFVDNPDRRRRGLGGGAGRRPPGRARSQDRPRSAAAAAAHHAGAGEELHLDAAEPRSRRARRDPSARRGRSCASVLPGHKE